VHAFECQIGREKLSFQVESVQAVDGWIHVFNQCAFQEEEDDERQLSLRVGTSDV
jgi:hypothetical protein